MGSLGLLATLTYDYDALFYLPLTGESEHAWPGVVDAKLPEVLTGQYKQAIILDGLLRHRTTEAASTIKTLEKARKDLSARSGGGREVGQGQADEPERVSDLSVEGDRGGSGGLDASRTPDLPTER